MTEGLGERAARLVEQGWCQKTSARDKEAKSVSVQSDKAVEFCLVAALSRESVPVNGFDKVVEYCKAVEWLSKALQDGGINAGLVAWNDDKNRAAREVAELLRKLPVEEFP